MKNKVLILGANGMAGHVITSGLREDPLFLDIISVARNNSLIKPDYLLDVTDLSSTINSFSQRLSPKLSKYSKSPFF